MRLSLAAILLLLSTNNVSAATCGGGNRGDGICADGLCCSEWGWCGSSSNHCSSGPTPSAPTPPPTPPTGGPTVAGDDSRLIAYAGNWQSCPTADQVEHYTHIVVAFAVSYSWGPTQNNCDRQCNIQSTVPICDNANNQALVDSWRAKGKKVILSFGGAGMGGHWAGDTNNCWDYCFGREDQVSTDLVNIVQNQNFDGIDIDYEYCYDTASGRHGGCTQMTGAYSDRAAQNFLSTMTNLLRQKMDALGEGYELTHAPIDVDLVSDSPYYQILRDQQANLNFLMPQFYNGLTRAARDGFDGSGSGQVSARSLYGNIANDMFQGQPDKIVFGFCISDCGATGSNVSGPQAVDVLKQIKAYNGGEYGCNGGGFFWVAQHDVGGSWGDLVSAEVAITAGCTMSRPGTGPTPPPTPRPTPSSGTGGTRCGCSSCTTSILERDADGYPVGGRIDWVVANMGQSEQEACSLVCGDEFPDVCSECNPGQCGGGGGGSGTCGNGNRGDGVCSDGTCCSEFGWCGTLAAHCG
mmetsp:Transcript_29584/g.62319  ORF Transcript_29584/g.62319 Transcript_29584/m.62319 type:complete len:522 (+) Transcript_29584:1631-3196(+)